MTSSQCCGLLPVDCTHTFQVHLFATREIMWLSRRHCNHAEKTWIYAYYEYIKTTQQRYEHSKTVNIFCAMMAHVAKSHQWILFLFSLKEDISNVRASITISDRRCQAFQGFLVDYYDFTPQIASAFAYGISSYWRWIFICVLTCRQYMVENWCCTFCVFVWYEVCHDRYQYISGLRHCILPHNQWHKTCKYGHINHFNSSITVITIEVQFGRINEF